MSLPGLPTMSLGSGSKLEHDRLRDRASRLELDSQYVEYLLERFRATQAFFPFVVVSAEWRASDMMNERPFLLLAAVASAANSRSQLQQSLAEEITESLPRRVIVGGEDNLDLLQGLLVHLAW